MAAHSHRGLGDVTRSDARTAAGPGQLVFLWQLVWQLYRAIAACWSPAEGTGVDLLVRGSCRSGLQLQHLILWATFCCEGRSATQSIVTGQLAKSKPCQGLVDAGTVLAALCTGQALFHETMSN